MGAHVAKRTQIGLHSSHCLFCEESAKAPVVYRECKDYVERISGAWNYRRCAACGSVWMDPQPDAEEIPGFYDGYYTHAAGANPITSRLGLRFGRFRAAVLAASLQNDFAYNVDGIASLPARPAWVPRRLGRKAASRAIRFLAAKPGGRLLDVGCGNGDFMAWMRCLGWEVEGIEMDSKAASVARGRDLTVYQASMEDAPIGDDRFDAITLSHVLEHVRNPAATLHRLYGVLRVGGLLVSISPNPRDPLALWYGKYWRGLEPPRHLALPSPAALRTLVRKYHWDADVFAFSFGTAGMMRDSRAFARFGRGPISEGWILEKLYAYLVSPLLATLRSDVGDEAVLVVRKG